MDQIIKILAKRLEGKGIEAAKIPSCIETIMNLSFFYPIPNYQDLNSRMQSFGWINVERAESDERKDNIGNFII